MSTDGMMDVEVPAHGTVIVSDGDVYGIESDRTDYMLCTCRDGKHAEYARNHNLSLATAPHVVGVQTVKMVWSPKA